MQVRVASLGRRLVAGLLDLVPESALAAAVAWAWFTRYPPGLPPRYWNVFDYIVDIANVRTDVALVFPVAFAAAFVLWETLWTATLGAAPMARLLGIRVVTSSGRRIGWFRSLLRAVLSLVLAAAAGIGPAWALLSPRRRMLHDILCASLAVRGPLQPLSGGGIEDRDDVPRGT
jgi:uncharacterized RDD family membrane protein YckC